MVVFIIAQIFGILGPGATIIATQMKDKIKYLLAYIVAYVLIIANYILLKAYSGAINTLILLLLTIIFSVFENKKFPTWLIILFSSLILLGSIITYENFYSLLPTIVSFISFAILLTTNMKVIRKYTLLLKLLCAIYDFLVMAYTACILDSLGFISSIVAIYRYDMSSIAKHK